MPNRRTDDRMPLYLFVTLVALDALIFFVTAGRVPDMLLLITAMAVARIPRVQTSQRGIPLVALITFLGLVILQWPNPALWCLNLAVTVHLLSLWTSRNRALNTWFSHAFILSSVIAFWYCLDGRAASWRMALLTMLGVAIMVVSWLMVQSRDSKPVLSYALLVALITPVTGAMVVGMAVANPVLRTVQRTLNQEGDGARGRHGRGSGNRKNESLGLNYSPGDGETEIMAYLAIDNPPAQPDQFKPPIYLREEGYSVFTGNGWVHSTKGREVHHDLDDGKEDGWTQTEPNLHASPTRFQVYIPDVRSSVLPALPGTNSLNVGRVSVAEDNGYHVVARRGGYITFQGTATTHHHGDLSDEAMKPANVDLRYYHVPDLETIKRLAATTTDVIGDASTAATKIRRIATYVRSSHTYLVQTDKARATLTNFLYGEKKGHCTLFATTTTLMLRMAGIPARVAVGFCGGTFDPKGGVFVFDTTSAHAWAEYKTKNHGWVILDTTPPASRPVGIAQNSDFLRNTELYSPLEKERSQVAKAADIAKAITPTQYQNYTILLLFVVVTLFYVVSNLVRIRARDEATVGQGFEPPHKPITDFFGRFCAIFAMKGVPRNRYQTANEYVHLLKHRGFVAEEWDDMLKYYYSVCYEGMPPSQDQEASFLTRLESLASATEQD